jgi:hypothetical protein
MAIKSIYTKIVFKDRTEEPYRNPLVSPYTLAIGVAIGEESNTYTYIDIAEGFSKQDVIDKFRERIHLVTDNLEYIIDKSLYENNIKEEKHNE